MLIRYFTSNMPFQQMIGLFITAVLLWVGLFFGYETWTYREHAEPLAILTQKLILEWPVIAGVLSLIIVLLQAFWLNYLVHRLDFLSKTSYLAAFLFLLFSGAVEGNLMPGASVLGNFFALGILHGLINAYDQENTLRSVFHAALFVGVGSLFYLPILGLWFFVIAALIIYRQIGYREIIFAILGLLPSVLGSFVYYFSKGEVYTHFQILNEYIFSWSLSLEVSLPMLLVGIMILSFLFVSMSYVLVHRNEQVIRVRRFITVLTWYLIFVLLLSGYAVDFFQQIILLAPVLAIFLGGMLENIRRKKLAEISLWIFILLVSIYRLKDVLQSAFGFDFPMYKIF